MIFTALLGNKLSKVIPKEQSNAVTADSFINKTATITLGVSKKGRPSEARLTDEHGQIHYVTVEPLKDEAEFIKGDQVLLVEKKGSIFSVIKK